MPSLAERHERRGFSREVDKTEERAGGCCWLTRKERERRTSIYCVEKYAKAVESAYGGGAIRRTLIQNRIAASVMRIRVAGSGADNGCEKEHRESARESLSPGGAEVQRTLISCGAI